MVVDATEAVLCDRTARVHVCDGCWTVEGGERLKGDGKQLGLGRG